MALTLPITLKLSALKQLAFKCGITTSGTKPVLIQRLIDEITASPTHNVLSTTKTKSPIRVLSIDMGIRNLAYCVLDIAPSRNTKTAKNSQPTIQDWHRLAVSSAPVTSPDLEAPIVKEAFDPSTLSAIAYTLLRQRLLLHNPTHVLIERQRFRSMGSKHILEWTIRVNMFESILYGVLYTLKGEGIWNGEVQAIAPKKVGPFWVGEEAVKRKGNGEESKKERKSKSMKTIHKGLKMDLVKSWLESGDVFKLGNKGVQDMARAYREKWDKLPGREKGKKNGEIAVEEKMGKLDDLADSLLQGMAWIEWEKNKRTILSKGYEALLEP